MADLLVRNISEGLREGLAARADRAGRSVSDEVKDILQRQIPETGKTSEVAEASAWEAMRAIFEPLTPEEREEFAAIMDDIEAERKKDFGRPFEDLE
jgi:plasmid stability protein